jgi:hypothetical protein
MERTGKPLKSLSRSIGWNGFAQKVLLHRSRSHSHRGFSPVFGWRFNREKPFKTVSDFGGRA